MKIIRLLLLLLLVFVAGNTAGTAAEQKESAASKAEQAFQVKLPEGLYLFQPLPQDKIYNLVVGSNEGKAVSNPVKDDFSPLFIVQNGKLIDPYSLANKIGIDKFNKKYVIGKTFYVYNKTERIGELTGVKLNFLDNWCSKEFLPNIAGKGKYKGNPLPERQINNSIYIHHSYLYPDLILPFASIKAIATLHSFQKSKDMETFSITEEDKTKAIEVVRENLLPEAMEDIRKRLRRHKIMLIGEKIKQSKLNWLKAVDLDGNGSKEIIGIYSPRIRYNWKSPEGKDYKSESSREILFLLWDTGKVERILLGDMIFSFGLGGIIDIDHDGIQELVIQVSVSRDSELSGKRIEIFRHDSSGWKRIYQSVKICSQIY